MEKRLIEKNGDYISPLGFGAMRLPIDKEYENSHSKITIQCLKCGNLFTKIACDHITSPKPANPDRTRDSSDWLLYDSKHNKESR